RAAAGESLFFFPEGTFTRRAGLREFRLGAFLTAAQAGLAVVPVAIRGTRTILPDETWRPQRAPVVLYIAAPLQAQGADWAAAVALRDAVRPQILARCAEPDLTALPE
ncbi:MAG: 1-acyl-sn-glycerol-3-phosphate acyltransferase, partial [Proteobacteria bacterium]|nr:1-acyl-sn-glycerol-3-phosphate acyltransferase [Pseudomonadota bacterium]